MSLSESKQTRNASLDVLRFLAIIVGIANHVVADSQYMLPLTDISWVIIEFITSIGKITPAIFFMLSGYFSKMNSMEKSVRKGIHYVGEFFVAAAFYSVLDILMSGKSLNLYYLLNGIWNFKYHLWFLTAYAGVTIISPILNKVDKDSVVYCMVIMFVFCVLLPSLLFIFPGVYSVEGLVSVLNGVIPKTFIFIGYYMFGRFFRLFSPDFKKYRPGFIAAYFVTLIVSVITVVRMSRQSGYVNELSTDNNSLFVFIESVSLFIVFLTININYNRLLSFLVPLCLDMYIIHVAFAELLTKFGITCTSFGTGWKIIIGFVIKDSVVIILSTIAAYILSKPKNRLRQFVFSKQTGKA